MKKRIINITLIVLILIFSTGICFAAKLDDPLGGITVPGLTGRVIKGILGIVGSLSLLILILGGFMWMTSGGNEEKIKKGQKMIVWSILGLVVIFSSYAILNQVFEILVE